MLPGLVPLVLPYPSLQHSVIYMSQLINPLLNQYSAILEKKKRNRTFIDPVTEVSRLFMDYENRIDGYIFRSAP